jgi:uncharacterized protein YqeY
MTLKDRITEDMKAALRAKDAARLSAIRLLLAAIKQSEIKQREIDQRTTLSDPEVVAVIDKMMKQRRDSIAQFEAAQRKDLADAEKFELSVLQAYMPQALSDAEIEAEVDRVLAALGASSPQDLGKVMAALKPALAGRADMAKVSALARARLSR